MLHLICAWFASVWAWILALFRTESVTGESLPREPSAQSVDAPSESAETRAADAPISDMKASAREGRGRDEDTMMDVPERIASRSGERIPISTARKTPWAEWAHNVRMACTPAAWTTVCTVLPPLDIAEIRAAEMEDRVREGRGPDEYTMYDVMSRISRLSGERILISRGRRIQKARKGDVGKAMDALEDSDPVLEGDEMV